MSSFTAMIPACFTSNHGLQFRFSQLLNWKTTDAESSRNSTTSICCGLVGRRTSYNLLQQTFYMPRSCVKFVLGFDFLVDLLHCMLYNKSTTTWSKTAVCTRVTGGLKRGRCNASHAAAVCGGHLLQSACLSVRPHSSDHLHFIPRRLDCVLLRRTQDAHCSRSHHQHLVASLQRPRQETRRGRKLQFSDRQLQIYFPTEDIMGAQNLDFVPKSPPNGGFLFRPNFCIFGRQFLKRKIFLW